MKSARNNPRNAPRTDNKKSAPGQRNATTSNRKASDAKNPKLSTNKAHSGMTTYSNHALGYLQPPAETK